MNRHIVIVVPGLGDNKGKFSALAPLWKKWYGIELVVHLFPWYGKESFETRLQRLVQKIDTLSDQGYTVSLMGTSAGGSAVMNAYGLRKHKIHRVVNVCGRLRRGERVLPTLEIAAIKSATFKESVLACESLLATLSPHDLRKIMTVRSFYDELVPTATIPVDGAHNIRILSVEHIISILLALTAYSSSVASFLLY
jgi:hypothetical protein